MKKGTLYLIPSAIAPGVSQKHLTPELKKALLGTQYFVAEHIREARRFISSLRLGITIEALHFTELNKRTHADEIKGLLEPIFDGHNLGVLSDAGCPGVADPGANIVAEAHRHKIKVVPIVGPSSILLSLMASGLSGQNFRFTGYLPINNKDLKNKLLEMERQSRKFQETQIFIETPYRADKMLGQLSQILHFDTRLTVAKDLTGTDEQIITLPIASWRKKKFTIGKIPTVFLFLVK